MVTARTEKSYEILGFTSQLVNLGVTAKDSIDSACKKVSRADFGRTDCAQPMIYASYKSLDVDAFVVYTDSETWFGSIHPTQALDQYNKKRNKISKLIVVGMTANNFSIADPEAPNMLDVVGFDTGTPSVISEFIAA